MNIVVMGVTGVGKTTIGQELAHRLGYLFLDADNFHSLHNKEKMAAGIPLTDADREPWLQSLNAALQENFSRGQNVVMACSALKNSYRETLSAGVAVRWVYLKGAPEKIRARIRLRIGHFAKDTLLASQLETLEEPADAITVDADRDEAEVVDDVLRQLQEQN
jgi:gluconokinase